MDIAALINIIQSNKCRVRLKVKNAPSPEGWNNGAIIPVAGYIEINGPWPIREVDWVELNPVVTEHVGRLVAPRMLNSFPQIEAALREANLPFTVSGEIIKVAFP